MASNNPYDALAAYKISLERKRIQQQELQDKIKNVRENRERLETKKKKLETDIEACRLKGEAVKSRTEAKRAEIARRRQYLATELKPELERREKRNQKHRDMLDSFKEIAAANRKKIRDRGQRIQAIIESDPRMQKLKKGKARREMLTKKLEQLKEQNRELEAVWKERVRRNHENWNAFTRWCIQLAQNWKNQQDQLKQQDENKKKQTVQLLSSGPAKLPSQLNFYPMEQTNKPSAVSSALNLLERLLKPHKASSRPAQSPITGATFNIDDLNTSMSNVWRDITKRVEQKYGPLSPESPPKRGRFERTQQQFQFGKPVAVVQGCSQENRASNVSSSTTNEAKSVQQPAKDSNMPMATIMDDARGSVAEKSDNLGKTHAEDSSAGIVSCSANTEAGRVSSPLPRSSVSAHETEFPELLVMKPPNANDGDFSENEATVTFKLPSQIEPKAKRVRWSDDDSAIVGTTTDTENSQMTQSTIISLDEQTSDFPDNFTAFPSTSKDDKFYFKQNAGQGATSSDATYLEDNNRFNFLDDDVPSPTDDGGNRFGDTDFPFAFSSPNPSRNEQEDEMDTSIGGGDYFAFRFEDENEAEGDHLDDDNTEFNFKFD